ncbi:uncharacterized protein LOC129600102 [Paramacrobiotus metropolitanus]|uniref:uncharacterized protein LOC129600102 n=1 Tax=Paramacrobiotus metropolitanus TaxID=2943436 RepID=UPI002445802B|nr:uncharacterized protein LOC129600102 [Paramacrobiotus metropolitanus]
MLAMIVVPFIWTEMTELQISYSHTNNSQDIAVLGLHSLQRFKNIDPEAEPLELADSYASDIIVVSVSEQPPWSFESPPGSGCFCGISISVLNLVGKQLGLRFKVRTENPTLYATTQLDGAKYSGSPAELLLGRVNISIASLAITSERKNSFDMVTGNLVRTTKISVHESWLTDSGYATQSILDALFDKAMTNAWVILVLAAAFTVATLCLAHRPKDKENRCTKLSTTELALNALAVAWSVAGSFLGQDDVRRPRHSVGVSIAVAVWLLCLYFGTSWILGNISSSLAASVMALPFSTIAQFVQSDFRPVVLRERSPVEFMEGRGLEPLRQRIRRFDFFTTDESIKVVGILSQTERLAVYESNDGAAMYSKAGFVPAINHVYERFISMFQMLHGSPLASRISDTVSWMSFTGSIDPVINVYMEIIHAAYGIPRVPRSTLLKKRTNSIGIRSLTSTIYVYFGFLSVAVMIFCIELCYAKYSERKDCNTANQTANTRMFFRTE